MERFSAHELRLLPQHEELVEAAARYGGGALVLFANPDTLRGNLGRRIRRHLQARGLRVTTRSDLCALQVEGR